MLSFNKFANKKKCIEFLNDFYKACEDNPYCNETYSVGNVEGFDVLKTVMNPKGTIAIGFVSEKPSYGILEFVKSKMRIPSNVKVIIMPTINPAHFIHEASLEENEIFWNSVLPDHLQLLYTVQEDGSKIAIDHTNHFKLTEELLNLVKQKGFKASNFNECRGFIESTAVHKYNIPCISVQTPADIPLKKRSMLNKDLMKFVIHNI